MTPSGVSIIILSYQRLGALQALLEALLRQDLAGIPIELIVCSNAPDVSLRASRFSTLGRLFRRFPDLKILNSSHNWLCRIRYTLATLARHDVILFLDDDLIPVHPGLIRQMAETLGTLGPNDILSCWTALWTKWDDVELTKVRMGFIYPQTTQLTECDYVGPGVSMFNKRILFHSGLLDLAEEFHRSDSTWFPWLTSMKLGSRKFYMPSYGMLRIHAEARRGALTDQPGFRAGQYAGYKKMWKRGYVPVLATERHQGKTDSPEAVAARTLRVEIDPW